MKLAKALEEKTLDIRLVDRLVAEGKLSKADLDAHLKNLVDDDGNFIELE